MNYETDLKLIQLLDEVPLHKWVFMGLGGYATVIDDYKFQVSRSGSYLGIYIYLKDFEESGPFYILETKSDEDDPSYESLKDLWDKVVREKVHLRTRYVDALTSWVEEK